MAEIKSEEIKGELSSVLSEGKGVFKNFKLSMKKHPLIEKNWLRFKENKFDGLIENWFKLLSESRKLEILSREEDLDNETDNLINSDFEFIPVSPEELQDLRSEYRGKTNSFFPFLEISPGLEKVLMGLTTVEEVLKLIELEDDEKGSKAYGLKSAINNTVLANTNVTGSEFKMNNYSEIQQIDNSKQFEQATGNQITYQDPSSQQATNITPIPNTTQTPNVVTTPNITQETVSNQQQAMPQTLNDLINKAN